VVVGGSCPTGTTVTGASDAAGMYEGVGSSEVACGFALGFVAAGAFRDVVVVVVGDAFVPSDRPVSP
jgi:homoaconitase/3-isopropylmalate dehydratase large subunit